MLKLWSSSHQEFIPYEDKFCPCHNLRNGNNLFFQGYVETFSLYICISADKALQYSSVWLFQHIKIYFAVESNTFVCHEESRSDSWVCRVLYYSDPQWAVNGISGYLWKFLDLSGAAHSDAILAPLGRGKATRGHQRAARGMGAPWFRLHQSPPLGHQNLLLSLLCDIYVFVCWQMSVIKAMVALLSSWSNQRMFCFFFLTPFL